MECAIDGDEPRFEQRCMRRAIGRYPIALLASLALLGCSNHPPGQRAASAAPLADRLAAAHPDYGRQIFHRCGACHNLGRGSGDRTGPNLWGVLGKPVATNSAHFGYTAALKAFGGIWTCARMDAWLTHPGRTVPGTSMTFEGLPDGADRADVMAWLADNGGAPATAHCPAIARGR
jgi:cytochrome c